MTRQDVLIDLINTNGYRNIAEIGVHRGKTARKVLVACELDSYGLVDPAWYAPLSKYLESYQVAHYYTMTSNLASRMYQDHSLDLVFLDALHDYDHVLEDIRLWMPKIRKGGVLCGDDYGQAHCEGVRQAVDEVFGDSVELRKVGVKGVKVWVVRI